MSDFSADAFRSRAQRWLAAHRGDADAGDHILNPDLTSAVRARALIDAAVLVPVIAHGDSATVLLTQRTDHLPSHAGQVAFPGGKIDPDDVSAEAAALREADEEIGLTADFIDTIGTLDTYLSNSGYRISPVLAIVRPGFSLTVNEGEVADVFEVPLHFLMSPDNHRRATRFFKGSERMFYEMPYGDRYIWGVTAGILRQVYERLYL
ncbi:MAG: CoA pyrophosphatase [Hyphomicrobiales bacterium]|nr:MAG: CoA pyrophosphatase [Hyphomicrobiales bacterium]